MDVGQSFGYSLLELLIVFAVAGTVCAMAMPRLAGLDQVRAAGGARYVAARLNEARAEAIRRSRAVAVRFTQTPEGYAFGVYVDGNGNGVRTHDITVGIDRELRTPVLLTSAISGADFGTLPLLPPPDAGSPPPGADPIRIGSSNILTFTPFGTATSGSLYIRGGKAAQYVVRVFGESGKIRVLRFDSRGWQWKPL